MRAACLFAVLLLGCDPALGDCDPARAETLVFDVNGYPAYEGQALVQVSCGNGVFCHAAELPPERRLGAPVGMSFDMVGSRTPSDRLLDVAGIVRLERGRETLLAQAGDCLAQVRSGAMPPGRSGVEVQALGLYPDLPRIDSAEGEDVLRNWLACGAPVVERTTEPRGGVGPGERCEPGEVGACVVRAEVEPVSPTFASIYARVLFPACGNSCHGPGAPELAASHDLDLSSPSVAYEALLRPGVEAVCGGAPRVVPGDPAASLLVSKIEERLEQCGDRMPISGPYLDAPTLQAIRDWISSGAPRA